MINVDEEGGETNQTVVKIEFFVEVTKDSDLSGCTGFRELYDANQQMELLPVKEIEYALSLAGNGNELSTKFGVSCLMESCNDQIIIDEVISREQWITIIMAIAGSLAIIIIFLSIAIHCLRKKYHVSF